VLIDDGSYIDIELIRYLLEHLMVWSGGIFQSHDVCNGGRTQTSGRKVFVVLISASLKTAIMTVRICAFPFPLFFTEQRTSCTNLYFNITESFRFFETQT